MKIVNRAAEKGNPFICIQTSKALRKLLEQAAERNKRRIQDEFIKRLQASFNNQEILTWTRDLLGPSVARMYSANQAKYVNQ